MSKRIVQVLLPKPFDVGFDYFLPDDLANNLSDSDDLIGLHVQVPFGRNVIWGVVWSVNGSEVDPKKIKTIKEISLQPSLQLSFVNYLKWVAEYTLSPVGSVLGMVLSAKDIHEPEKQVEIYALGDMATVRMSAARKAVFDVLEGGASLSKGVLMKRSGASSAVIKGLVEKGALNVTFEAPTYAEPVISPLLPTVILNESQSEAAETLKTKLAQGFSTILIDGVTGSGKTEVYFEMLREVMKQNRQALVLLPEIVLTNQFISRFTRQFGFAPTEWHSGLTPAKRRDNWKKIANGKAKLIVGARSALFLPYADLGCIIVDEEHESAYKQEEGVMYHGRDMAVVRGNFEKLPVVLVSASPSVESQYNAELGKYEVLTLKSRYGGAHMPDIDLIDMRAESLDAQHFISEKVKLETADAIARGEQVLFFLNRRGYAPLTLCRHCGYRFESPEASVWMVMHQPIYGKPYLMCHHSGYTMPVPKACPDCKKEETFAACGPGVERLEEEIRAAFVGAKTLVMASDVITTPKQADEAIRRIESNDVDIIIGTQMVAKGHHFPHLTRVVIVDADMGLEGGDLRASERTFQLLHQVGGRAGREAKKGRVLVQTYQPNHPVMQALFEGDRDGFVREEILRRNSAHLPPFSRMAAVILSGVHETSLMQYARQLSLQAPNVKGVEILGPAPALIYRLRNNFRVRLLVIADRNISIQKLVKQWLASLPPPSTIRCKVDVDPQSFT